MIITLKLKLIELSMSMQSSHNNPEKITPFLAIMFNLWPVISDFITSDTFL